MNPILPLIGRDQALFTQDIESREQDIAERVAASRFLVLGGAGTIGQAVTREIFRRNPRKLDVVDLSENNLAELVRDLRSSQGYIDGEFRTFALDIGSLEFDALMRNDGEYDYLLNLSALKHVRSEKDPYTLMRMIDVNIGNTDKTLRQAVAFGAKKYFCVSTDKAANPVSMMGASKRIMEMFLVRRSAEIDISTARFANVAFSDGSLLHSFNQRLLKHQPIVAPRDVLRYFLTDDESGQLCLMSCLYGESRDVFFPRLSEALHLVSFADIAENYLRLHGYRPRRCESEDEARALARDLPANGEWPCLFTDSDTSGEKEIEEFHTDDETPDLSRFDSIGVIRLDPDYDAAQVAEFEREIATMRHSGDWDKARILALFHRMIPGFGHRETGRYLDGKM